MTLEHVGIFADGLAVRRVGEETFRLARQYVVEVVLVGTDQICAAIPDIFEDTRGIANELLFRFEFPERPGALLKILRAISTQWNISLFHYRNHGSDYRRVLAGIQVAPKERAEFISHIDDLRYAYTEETNNPAYRMFLGT